MTTDQDFIDHRQIRNQSQHHQIQPTLATVLRYAAAVGVEISITGGDE